MPEGDRSSSLRWCPRPEQLTEVVAGDDEVPFSLGGLEPAKEQRLAAVAGVDLAEHRLG